MTVAAQKRLFTGALGLVGSGLNRLKRKACLLLYFLRHARNSAYVALNIFDVIASPDGVERAKRFPDVLFVGGDVGQRVSGVDPGAVPDMHLANFPGQLGPDLEVSHVRDQGSRIDVLALL